MDVPRTRTVEMSVAGLRFGYTSHTGTPLETKSGSYIYYGDPQSFHDWEFRTMLRIRMHETKIQAVLKAAAEIPTAEPDAQEQPPEPEAPQDEYDDQPFGPTVTPPTTQSHPIGSPKGSVKSASKSIDVDWAPLVNKVVEGLRGDAFLIARDVGLVELTKPDGLVKLVSKIRSFVFPRAAEEAKELFRAGQKHQGPLSRQHSESMLSYTQRRARWWRILQELDPTISLSESLRTELMLELSGLTRQEILVVKACSTDKSFDSITKILVEHYSGVHLREGSRSWTQSSGSKGKGVPFKGKGKGKFPFKSFGYHRAYNASLDEEQYDDWEDHQPWMGDDDYEPYEYVGMLGGTEEGEVEEQTPEEDEYEYWDDVDEEEAIALNCMVEVADADHRTAGDAIQLQLAAHAAFGKAKGKGKGKSGGKGKFGGKGKGKVAKSHLSIEQRRAKLAELKKNSKCLRCGSYGHWAGDPQCKIPNAVGKGSGHAGKTQQPTANLATMSDSSSDDGMYVGASPTRTPTAYMAIRAGPKPTASPARPSAARGSGSSDVVTEGMDRRYRPSGSERKFPVGQFKGKTFWTLLHRHRDFYQWAKNNSTRSPYYVEYVRWVDTYFTIEGDKVFLRQEPVEPPPEPMPGTSRTTRTPPNPPLPQKCRECKDFSKKGSAGYTIKLTCLTCGHAETKRRDLVAQYTPDVCPHTDIDHRGSSRSVHRTFCKLCLSFIDEMPSDMFKTRVETSKKVQSTDPVRARVVQDVVEDDPQEITSQQVENILHEFAGLVASGSQSEAVTRVKLHEWLNQATDTVLDEDSFSMLGDEIPGDSATAYVSLCLHGDGSTEMTDGIVQINQQTKDVYDMDDPDVYAVLDEGCNASCHSRKWAVMAESKLARKGYTMLLDKSATKTFTGLGPNGTSTEGLQSFPFSLQFLDGDVLNGVMESHQSTTGDTPLLLSLHAQTHLGLVKNLANGTCTIQGQELPLFRCRSTGLLMINLTAGLVQASFRGSDPVKDRAPCTPFDDDHMNGPMPCDNHVDIMMLHEHSITWPTNVKVPKCHRKFRITHQHASYSPSSEHPTLESRSFRDENWGVAMTARSNENIIQGQTFRQYSHFVDCMKKTMKEARESRGGKPIVIHVTRGERFSGQPPFDDLRHLTLDLGKCHDPAKGKFVGCVGRRKEIVDGLLSGRNFKPVLEEALRFILCRGLGVHQWPPQERFWWHWVGNHPLGRGPLHPCLDACKFRQLGVDEMWWALPTVFQSKFRGSQVHAVQARPDTGVHTGGGHRDADRRVPYGRRRRGRGGERRG